MKVRCVVPRFKIDEIIEVSDIKGFDKETFNGWYIEEPIDDVVSEYFHHSCDWYNADQLEEFDSDKCRIITKFNSLEI